jgi:hypothetical protein
VFLELVLDVLDLTLIDLSSADGTLLDLRDFVLDITSELVFLSMSLHEPISVDTEQVESVETLVYSD